MSTKLLLRIGLAAVFLYPAVSSYLHPDNWIGYFPGFLRALVPDNMLLISFSGYEVILALWILIGKWQFISALLATFTLTGIIIFNLTQIDITFRDIGLVFMSLALTLDSKKENIT